MVTALTVFASKPDKRIKVTPIYFIRDLVFYILVMLYLLGVMIVVQEINIYISVGFLLLYLIYVVLVVVQSNGDNSIDEERGGEVSELQNIENAPEG